jgi:hypothetical protein
MVALGIPALVVTVAVVVDLARPRSPVMRVDVNCW